MPQTLGILLIGVIIGVVAAAGGLMWLALMRKPAQAETDQSASLSGGPQEPA